MVTKVRHPIALAMLVFLLTGCQSAPTQNTDQPNVSQELSQAIEQNRVLQQPKPVQVPDELDDQLLSFSPEATNQRRFNISADQVPVAQFFQDLMASSGLNILADADIDQSISLQLRNVTVEEVLDALNDIYGYDYHTTGYGYRVMADRLTTRIFHLNYLNVSRSGMSDTGITGSQLSLQGGQSSQVSTSYSADFWSNLESTLRLIIEDKPGRSIVTNAQTGIVVVRANPDELRSIQHFLDRAELSLQKQVIIEARILEVSLTSEFQSGINWANFSGDISAVTGQPVATGLDGASLTGQPGTDGVFSLGILDGNFTGIIQLLSTQGDVQVLSSPRISTVNNQKAVIKVGTDDFFVTNVTSTGGDDPEPEVEFTPFFSGIALDVTPQIGDNNEIILHVRPSVTEVEERSRVINLGTVNYQLPLASLSIREADSIIRATNGQIVVIGGLLQNKADDTNTGVPGLSNIPGLKFLFGQERKVNSKSELVILLQPRITDADTWQDILNESRNNTLQP